MASEPNASQETPGKMGAYERLSSGSNRKRLPHEIPLWIDPAQEVYFITVCCARRRVNQLCLEPTGGEFLKSALFRQTNGKFFVPLLVLMPDHFHGLFTFPRDGQGIQGVMSVWKGWAAKQWKIQWQRDFFEHRIRGEESRREKADYILANPVRAGLAASFEDWPYWFASDSRSGTVFSPHPALDGSLRPV